MTNNIKKIITDIIIFLILVVSIPNVSPNDVGTVLASSKVKSTGKQTAVYKAYKNLLLNGKNSIVLNTPGNIYKYFLKYVNANPDTYLFTLKDLNGDHIDELFIKDGKWDASYGYNSWVFSYNPNDKKIYNIIWDDIEGVCSYTPLKNGVLLQRYWYAGGQSDSFTFYKLGSDNKGNKVKELNYFVGDWEDLPPYRIDQKEVTKEKWNKVLKSDFINNKISKNQWHKCNKKSIQKYLN